MKKQYQTKDVLLITTIIYVILALVAIFLSESTNPKPIEEAENLFVDGADFTSLINLGVAFTNLVISIFVAILYTLWMAAVSIPTLIISRAVIRKHIDADTNIDGKAIKIRIAVILGIAVLLETIISLLSRTLVMMIICSPIVIVTLFTFFKPFNVVPTKEDNKHEDENEIKNS